MKSAYCLRPKAKGLGITWVVLGFFFLHNSIGTHELIFPLSRSFLSLLPSLYYHSIYLLIYLSLYLSPYLFITLLIYWSIYHSINHYVSIYLPFYLLFYLYLSITLSCYLSYYLYLSTYPSLSLSFNWSPQTQEPVSVLFFICYCSTR